MNYSSLKTDLFIWAHRGASARAPENTMSAFQAAEEAGADGIELDVHLSREGVPVVIHDDTVDRTSDGTGRVSDKRISELLDLDAGAWFSETCTGERIPLLADVLAWAGTRLRINIEIKDEDAGQVVMQTLQDFPRARVLISSFHHKALFRLRQFDTSLPIGFLIETPFWRLSVRRAIACSAESFHPSAKYLTRNLITACHDKGLSIFPWTDGKHLRKSDMLRRGVDGYFTDLP